jgi:hypothetical protein
LLIEVSDEAQLLQHHLLKGCGFGWLSVTYSVWHLLGRCAIQVVEAEQFREPRAFRDGK